MQKQTRPGPPSNAHQLAQYGALSQIGRPAGRGTAIIRGTTPADRSQVWPPARLNLQQHGSPGSPVVVSQATRQVDTALRGPAEASGSQTRTERPNDSL